MRFMYDTLPVVEAFSTVRDEQLPYPVLQPHQTHGTDIAVIEDTSISREQLQHTDVLITPLKGIAIGVRTADCIPVLLYDRQGRAVAAVHAGWRGTVAGLPSKALSMMCIRYGIPVDDVSAVIGPGIGPDSFQVGEDVVQAFSDAGFPMDRILTDDGPAVVKCALQPATAVAVENSPMRGGFHIDLWMANRMMLEKAGVGNVAVAGVCTYLRNDIFYSARREGLKCPRIITSIKIR